MEQWAAEHPKVVQRLRDAVADPIDRCFLNPHGGIGEDAVLCTGRLAEPIGRGEPPAGRRAAPRCSAVGRSPQSGPGCTSAGVCFAPEPGWCFPPACLADTKRPAGTRRQALPCDMLRFSPFQS